MSDVFNVVVLLIEPEKLARELLTRHVVKYLPDVTVLSTGDLAEALDFLGKHTFDIVVCDAFLAGENRMNFVNELCEHTEDVAIVVITGESSLKMETLEATGCRLQVKEVFYKPLDLGEVLCKMQGLVNAIKARRTNN
jgi:DNA-binding response OmpR family regulator